MNKTEHSHLIDAYDKMMERVRGALEHAGHEAIPTLQRGIEKAAHKAVELGELSRDEADQIGQWLQRDLDDAGYYLASTGKDLGQWLRFDIEQVESRLLELFANAADRTRLEFLEFENRVAAESEYHTGEITAPGTLLCDNCGKKLHFHATGHIPPCPICHQTVYRRAIDDNNNAPPDPV